MKATEIFTPNDFPRYTYVSRAGRKYEEKLKQFLEIPGTIATVSGPSKSGKTILLRRVVGDSNLIIVPCGGVTTSDSLWNKTLDRIGAPQSTTTSVGKDSSTSIGGELSAPSLLFSTSNNVAKVSLNFASRRSATTATTAGRRGASQVSELLSKKDVVLLLDDFHFIPRSAQEAIAEELKGLASDGVHIALTVAAHRSDDLERATSQLTGRVGNVSITRWNKDELVEIAHEGFAKLNVAGDILLPHELVREAAGSPQLMQLLCLFTAQLCGFNESPAKPTPLVLDGNTAKQVMSEATSLTQRSTVAQTMLNGPKPRGTQREIFKLKDGSRGDVYYCVTRALVADPPNLEHQYDDLKARVETLVGKSGPTGGGITSALEQMCELTMEPATGEKVLDWDSVKRNFNIVDPYLWFFLRWSDFLANWSAAAVSKPR